MNGWTFHSGQAVCLPGDNIDTDQIIPARFMSQPRVDGYQDFLFHDIRREPEGRLITDFPLNSFSEASVIFCGNNFGCGSSREAAAYALFDAGIRVVVAQSFGDIFAANAVNNGLLPAIVTATTKDRLARIADSKTIDCQVDLETRTIRSGTEEFNFEIDDTWRTKLMHGWDDIDMTLQHNDLIKAFKEDRRQSVSWAWPPNRSM